MLCIIVILFVFVFFSLLVLLIGLENGFKKGRLVYLKVGLVGFKVIMCLIGIFFFLKYLFMCFVIWLLRLWLMRVVCFGLRFKLLSSLVVFFLISLVFFVVDEYYIFFVVFC